MINTNSDITDTNSSRRSRKGNDETRNQQRRPRVGKRQRLDPVASKVVIVGAGLAGLSVALSLRRAGFRHIEVYERDPSLDYQKEGYGLTLTYNPKGPLSNLGILETVAQHDCPSRSHYLFRQEEQEELVSEENDEEQEERHDDENGSTKTKIKYGTPIGYFGNAFFDSSTSSSAGGCRRRRGYGQRGNLRVPRKVLRRILYEKLLQTQQEQQEKDNVSNNAGSIIDKEPIIAVHWNHSLVDYKWDELTQQYHIRFSNSGDSNVILNTTADLLVAADGIRSSVLQQLYNTKIAEEEEMMLESQSSSAPTLALTSLLSDNRNTGIPLSSPSPPPPPSIRESPKRYGLRPMGVRLILGIADGIDHPLLSERGFYTVDTKGHRLFTMPYHSDRFDFNSSHNNNNINSNKKTTNKHRIMWQLSFSTDRKTASPSSLDAKSLREYVLRIFKSWHPPVLDLVHSTPIEMIWGTDLMDRNPRQVYEDLIVGRSAGRKGNKSGGGSQSSKLRQPRLVVCGDALHSMSPFKGQGANQALTDGPLLSKWLLKSSIDASLTNWWRETLNRTVPIVESSRKSAQVWHNPKLILQSSGDEHAEYNGFAGVRPSAIPSLVQTLRRRGIGPHLDGDLDDHIRRVIQEHDWFDDANVDDVDADVNEENKNSSIYQERVLQLASNGDTEGLRQMSLGSTHHHYHYCAAMVEAKDEQCRTSLHLAAMNNQLFTCHWLLVEMRVLKQWYDREHRDNDDIISMEGCGNERAADGPLDINGKTAYDYAVQTGDKKLIHIFQIVMNDEDIERQREKMKKIDAKYNIIKCK